MRESSRMQGNRAQQANNNNNNTNNKDESVNSDDLSKFKKSNVILKMMFVENLDLILAACEDNNIYVWGFDQDAVKILKDMKYDESQGEARRRKRGRKKRRDQAEPVVVEQDFDYFDDLNYMEYLSGVNNQNVMLSGVDTVQFLKEPVEEVKPIEADKTVDESESVSFKRMFECYLVYRCF